MKIGFVTCTPDKLAHYFPTIAEPDFLPAEPPFTPDDQIAVDQLRQRGYEVAPIVWGCAVNTLHHFNLIVIRSPWDYMDSDENKNNFIAWVKHLEQAGLKVCNPSNFMRWMLDKHYLQHLDNEGIAVIPTRYYEIGSHIHLLDIFRRQGEFILKPCISAAGIGLFHIDTEQAAKLHQNEINIKLQTCSYMEQDFIKEITSSGEWSLIFLGGTYSHAVHKKPGVNSILVHAERGGSLSFSQQPASHLIEFAISVYNKMFAALHHATGTVCDPDSILYLRIDIIDTSSGPLLIECEGVEPELFFRAQDNAKEKFYLAVKKILNN